MITLTKYQASKIKELMCPACRGELKATGQLVYTCTDCESVFQGYRLEVQS